MNLIRQGEEVYFAILDAGQNWCESIFEFEVLLEESNVISFVITPVTGQGIKNVDMILEGLPPRKGKACRVKILGDCIAECIIRIRVYDMGFGELVEATDLEWIEEIEI